MITIRPACAGDAADLERLYRQLTGDTDVQVLPERIRQLAADPNTRLLVAESAEKVCGTVLITLCQDVMYGKQPFAVLENLVVCETQRGRGVGQQLLAAGEALCLPADCSKMMLLSSSQRHDAHRFFERSGFKGDSKRGFVRYRSQFGQAGQP